MLGLLQEIQLQVSEMLCTAAGQLTLMVLLKMK